MQASDAKLESMKMTDSDAKVLKAKIKEKKRKAKVEDEKIITDHVSSDTAKPNKLRRVRPRKEPVFGESRISPQAVLDATDRNLLWNDSIWFSLAASENQWENIALQLELTISILKSCNNYMHFINYISNIFLYVLIFY